MNARTRTRTRPGAGQVADGTARPQLTSLVDMMVILVVFLLHSFSADGQLVEPAPGIDLPLSSLRAPVPQAVQVTVGVDEIRVAGRPVAGPGDPAVVGLVQAALTACGAGPCAVQVDRGVPYRVLASVLAGCSAAGRSDVRLVVREDS